MIEVDKLSKRFGAFTAVDRVSFSVKAGEVLGFLGPNGAGKSTTMKLITGFLSPTSGTVTVLGDKVHRRPTKVRRQMGYLPEGAPNYGDMRVADFLRFIAEVRGLGGRNGRLQMHATVERLQLQAVMDQPISTLSKGFNRRVGIAQALVHDPAVLIMDEPTDGLDPNQKHQVRELLRSLATDKTVIISTHILEEVESVCHRALIIADGQVRADTTPDELLKRSAWYGAVSVELADATRAAERLARLPNVDRVEHSIDNANRFTLLPKSGQPIFADVQQALAQDGWKPDAISLERGRLDDVFRDITQAHMQPEVTL